MKSPQLKIATWNLDRPTFRTKEKNDSIVKALYEVDADILVLTETNSCIDLSEKYTASFASACLYQSLSIGEEIYEEGENRVTIWSKLPGQRRIDMCNSHSAVCAQFTTDWGSLNVYGTVIGIYGKGRGRTEPTLNGKTDFERTLEVQLDDWVRLSSLGKLCIAGDFNLSFADSYYVTKEHRQTLVDCFEKLQISIPTQVLTQNIDQIAISSVLLETTESKTETWPKGNSDHNGVWLTLEGKFESVNTH